MSEMGAISGVTCIYRILLRNQLRSYRSNNRENTENSGISFPAVPPTTLPIRMVAARVPTPSNEIGIDTSMDYNNDTDLLPEQAQIIVVPDPERLPPTSPCLKSYEIRFETV